MQIALILYIYGTQPSMHSFLYSAMSTPMYQALSDMSSQLTSGVWGDGYTFGQLEFKGCLTLFPPGLSALDSISDLPSSEESSVSLSSLLLLYQFFLKPPSYHKIPLSWRSSKVSSYPSLPSKPLSNLHSLCVFHLHLIPQPLTTHPPISVITALSKVTCCCCSVTQSCLTLCDPMDCSTPGPQSLTISQSLPKFMSTALVMPSSHLTLWLPLLLLPSISPSIRDFANELAVCIRWPKYWSFSFSISPSNEYSGLISLKIDRFDLLAGQGTLRSLLQHHSLKETSVLWCSAFFTIQLLPPCMTAGKTRALTIWTFVSRVMSLLFNTLSSLS